MSNRISHIFQSIETMHPDQLTERELEIIESMERQYYRKGSLSEAQEDLLEEIYKRAQGR